MKSKASLFLLAIVFALGVIFLKPLITYIKVILFISEQFPQIPIKPLSALTSEPLHSTVQFDSPNGKVVADLIVPAERFDMISKKQKPALILAMGVKTQTKDKVVLLNFAKTLARLGYVVFWPRLEILDKGVSSFEEPETFIKSFEYLSELDVVDKTHISFVGFSVGSSIALVAAEDARINNNLHSLIFFGGYYNLSDYLAALVNKTGAWQPAEGAVSHVLEIAKEKKWGKSLNDLRAAQETQSEIFRRLSPSPNLKNFRARIFIIHDKNDLYVPYTESIKLNRSLPSEVEKTFVLIDLFEHVQPKKELSWQIVFELLKLYGFLDQVFYYF